MVPYLKVLKVLGNNILRLWLVLTVLHVHVESALLQTSKRGVFRRLLGPMSSETILQIAFHMHTLMPHARTHACMIGIFVDKNLFYIALNKLKAGFIIGKK